MAEPRRVHLTTLTCELPPSSNKTVPAQKSPSCVMMREKETGTERPADTDTDTVRLVLALFEPDDRNFPEFSYSQLVDNKGSKTKKKDRIQDMIDIGYGYDDEDSFIDNSEAYDEFVPASITTKYGGFYVNCGVLHFRQASDTETENLTKEEKTPEPPKKRKLNGGQDKPKKKPYREDEEMKNAADAESSTLSESVVIDEMKKKKKKKKAVGTLSVTSMLKKFQKEKERERQKMEKANQKASAVTCAPRIPLFPADAAGGGGSGLTDPLLSLIGSTNDHALIQAASTVDFDIDLDSLLDVTEETLSPKSFPQASAETQLLQTQSGVSSDARPPNRKTNHQLKPLPEQNQLESETGSASSHQCVPLPQALPPQLEERVRKLMQQRDAAQTCKEAVAQTRVIIFFILLADPEDPPNVEDPMQKLKEAVGRAMPEQIARFHQNCQTYEQVKTSKATEDGPHVGPEDNMAEKGGKRGGPKKLFKWNEEIRECLCQVLREKMDRYQKEIKGSQEMEEYLKTLLDNEVKPLWPKGWMQSRVLIRESKKMLGLFTAVPVKKTRTEKKPSSISGAPTPSDNGSILQGTPPLKGEPDVFIESSYFSGSKSLGAAKKENVSLKNAEGKTEGGAILDAGSSTPVETDVPVLNVASAPAHSLLDVLADQALAQDQTLTMSQELLAVAVAKYKHSLQHWSFSVDTKSPPFPPPPPQSSPVGFPVTSVCQVVLPRALQDVSRHGDVGQIPIICDSDDDDDVVIQ
ncbi:hypothetical protein PAMA_016674 [Pampus argenteus]